MNPSNPLDVDDLIRELGAGSTTVKFILDRFSPLLSPYRTQDDNQYAPLILPMLIRIHEMLSSGMLPTQIETIFEAEHKNSPEVSRPETKDESNNGDIWMNREALSFIQDMVKDIRGQQERIAAAHEKRADAEERKAVAIEKRADAEEKKAAAMNNIAAALQEMNQLRSFDSQSIEVAGQAAHAMIVGGSDPESPAKDTIPPTESDENNDDVIEHPQVDVETVLDAPQTDVNSHNDLNTNNVEPILNTGADEDTLTKDSLEHGSLTDIDDLSLLVDEAKVPEDEMDDLFALVDTVSGPQEMNTIDDIDDLSLLIESPSPSHNVSDTLDDLSRLIDEPEPDDTLDDLSALIEPEAHVINEEASNLPSLKPDITPQEDLAKYKSAVMKIIIDLKAQGLSAKETTDRLNKDGVATLSGKPKWAEPAILKIYGFIDSAN